MRGIGGGQKSALLNLASQKHPRVRHEHIIEHHNADRLAVMGGKLRRRFTRAPGRPRHNRHALRINRHGAAHSKILIPRCMGAAGHDQEFVHIRRAGNDGLGAGNHNPVLAPLLDMHISIAVGLKAGAFRAVALGIRHGDAKGEVLVLHLVQIGQKPLRIIRAVVGVQSVGRLINPVQRVMGKIALGAAGDLADQPHRIELFQQIIRALVDMQHAVDDLARRALQRQHQGLMFRRMGEIIGHAHRIDTGKQQRLIRHAFHARTIDEHARGIAAQRLAVIGGGHQHGWIQRFEKLNVVQ